MINTISDDLTDFFKYLDLMNMFSINKINTDKILRKITAVVLGIEVGIIIIIILQMTFVLYLVPLIFAILLSSAFNLDYDQLQSIFGIAMMLFTIIISILFYLDTVDKYFKTYWISALILPVIIIIFYIIF